VARPPLSLITVTLTTVDGAKAIEKRWASGTTRS